jgi:hypothetical protein
MCRTLQPNTQAHTMFSPELALHALFADISAHKKLIDSIEYGTMDIDETKEDYIRLLQQEQQQPAVAAGIVATTSAHLQQLPAAAGATCDTQVPASAQKVPAVPAATSAAAAAKAAAVIPALSQLLRPPSAAAAEDAVQQGATDEPSPFAQEQQQQPKQGFAADLPGQDDAPLHDLQHPQRSPQQQQQQQQPQQPHRRLLATLSMPKQQQQEADKPAGALLRCISAPVAGATATTAEAAAEPAMPDYLQPFHCLSRRDAKPTDPAAGPAAAAAAKASQTSSQKQQSPKQQQGGGRATPGDECQLCYEHPDTLVSAFSPETSSACQGVAQIFK